MFPNIIVKNNNNNNKYNQNCIHNRQACKYRRRFNAAYFIGYHVQPL